MLGALRWAMPSSSTYHALERSAACAPCMRAQSFVAHGGGGGDGLLPVSYEPLSPRSPGGRLFPYFPFPGSAQRLAGMFASPASAQASSSSTPAPEQQPAPRLGGGEAPADAKAAAAAAAAARAAGK